MATPDLTAAERVLESPPQRKVSVAVLFVDEDHAPAAIAAVRAQVYETTGVTLVGGAETGAALAGRADVEHQPSLSAFIAGLGTGDDYVWIVHGDARPRRDALGALVFEADRNDAGVVGSKILDAGDPRLLEAVGASTDVFGEPYTGLDPGEVDLEQYDVVRDVAYVSGVSLLVRRDLLRGLGGTDPKLPPVSAGLDFSQRARVAGARVMVAPTSEVLHARECGHDVATWQELAGRQRAMMKAYRWITLVWVIPVGLLLAFVDAFARLLLGKADVLRNVLLAVGWNLYHLPSTLFARRRVAAVRVTKDEELFRYQVAGSIRLRSAAAAWSERMGWIIDEEPGVVTEEEMEGTDGRTASIIVSILGAVVVAVAARQLWFGAPPASGFSLPGARDSAAVLASYSGGWNPTGLGSPDPIHPAGAALGLVQTLMFGWSGAQSILTIVSMLAGYFGIGRLARRLGVDGAGRHLGGVVYLLGPFALAMSGASYWPGLIALGGLPLALDTILSKRRWLGRFGLLTLLVFLSAPFAPMTALVIVIASILGALVTRRFRWTSVVWALIAAGIGAVLIAPTLLMASADELWSGGPRFDVAPGVVIASLILALGLGAIVGAQEWRVAAWSALLVAGALVVPVIPDAGAEPLAAAAVMGSLGLAILVAAAFESGPTRRWPGLVAGLAAAALLVISFGQLPGGQLGLPDDEWTRRLAFVESLSPATGPDRILVVGEPFRLPGEYRVGEGFAYRLINGGMPTLDQALLPDPRVGDEALDLAIDAVILRASPRPGAALAPFAIRWVVVLGDSPMAGALEGQVDLKPIPVTRDVEVFENLAVQPRAVSNVGTAWTSGLVDATGPASTGRLRVADNADPRWGPGWVQVGWFNDVSTENGITGFAADPLRRAFGWLALGVLALSIPLAVWGREERS